MFLYSVVSNELLEDGLGYDEQLRNAMVQSSAWFLDDAFLNGDGVGKPLGVLNDPALVTQAAEVGQAATTITYTNLVRMYSRMYPAGRKRAVKQQAIPGVAGADRLIAQICAVRAFGAQPIRNRAVRRGCTQIEEVTVRADRGVGGLVAVRPGRFAL